MSNRSINKHILELQKELERLQSATTHIETARDNSNNIIRTLEEVQINYTNNTQQIGEIFANHAQQMVASGNEQLVALKNSYKNYVEEVKELTQSSINNSVVAIRKAQQAIDETATSNLAETQNLIQQHSDIVTRGQQFLDTINSFNLLELLQKTQKELTQIKDLITDETNKQQQHITTTVSSINRQTNDVHSLLTDNITDHINRKIGLPKSGSKQGTGIYGNIDELKSQLRGFSNEINSLKKQIEDNQSSLENNINNNSTKANKLLITILIAQVILTLALFLFR